MGKATPRARLFMEGGGIVTGTHDIPLARRMLVEEYLEGNRGITLPLSPDDHDGRAEVAEVSRLFAAHKARRETGRIVPESPANRECSGYAWWWRAGYDLGKPGVTRAVVWQ